MRQFMLVILLVGAAFLGGAFVNGPGLQWAQAKILRSLGLNNGGEITSLDLRPMTETDVATEEAGLIKPERDDPKGPVAPTPSIVLENESQEAKSATRSLTPDRSQKAAAANQTLHRGQTPPSTPSIKQPVVAATGPMQDAPVTDPELKPVSSPVPPVKRAPDPDTPPALLDALPVLLPASRPGSDMPATAQQAVSPQKASTDGTEDWVVLERKMQSLGVSHYTTEGQPGGRVVFACLIPLAGRQAVAQRFEAEGDDPVQAARAALRRVVLWRATQPADH